MLIITHWKLYNFCQIIGDRMGYRTVSSGNEQLVHQINRSYKLTWKNQYTTGEKTVQWHTKAKLGEMYSVHDVKKSVHKVWKKIVHGHFKVKLGKIYCDITQVSVVSMTWDKMTMTLGIMIMGHI